MRSLTKLTTLQLKLFFRDPTAMVFTLGFPLMLIIFFGGGANAAQEQLGGLGRGDILVPGYIGWIIATTGLMALTSALAMDRENRILRLFGATPLRPATLLVAYVLAQFFITTVGMGVLVAIAKISFGMRFLGNPVSLFAAYFLACMSFYTLSFVLAGVVPTGRATQRVSTILFFPMIFFTGATIPFEGLPHSAQQIGQFLPLTYVISLLRGVWAGGSWSAHGTDLAVLLSILVIGVAVSAKTVRWE